VAQVYFTIDYYFDSPAPAVWHALIDWKGHESWIPSTQVELHGDGDPTAIGAEFTAWTGIALGTSFGRKLALQDHMRVDALNYDEASRTGHCLVTKLGPQLSGTASFTVRPADSGPNRTHMHWVEDVALRHAPQFTAPFCAAAGKAGFLFGMTRLARQLRG